MTQREHHLPDQRAACLVQALQVCTVLTHTRGQVEHGCCRPPRCSVRATHVCCGPEAPSASGVPCESAARHAKAGPGTVQRAGAASVSPPASPPLKRPRRGPCRRPPMAGRHNTHHLLQPVTGQLQRWLRGIQRRSRRSSRVRCMQDRTHPRVPGVRRLAVLQPRTARWIERF